MVLTFYILRQNIHFQFHICLGNEFFDNCIQSSVFRKFLEDESELEICFLMMELYLCQGRLASHFNGPVAAEALVTEYARSK